jgi:hypothetical protein
MSLEQWWNDTGMEKWKYWEENLPLCHFIHHKSHSVFNQVKYFGEFLKGSQYKEISKPRTSGHLVGPTPYSDVKLTL